MAIPYTSNQHNLLNTKAAAKFLGGDDNPISTSTLALWRSKGIGPTYIKVGNSVRYSIEDLRNFIQTSCQPAKIDGSAGV